MCIHRGHTLCHTPRARIASFYELTAKAKDVPPPETKVDFGASGMVRQGAARPALFIPWMRAAGLTFCLAAGRPRPRRPRRLQPRTPCLTLTPPPGTPPSNDALFAGNKAIVTKGVNFALPGGRQLISDFTFEFLPGERLGIAGPNGVGKSTLLDLITGAAISGDFGRGMDTS